ncbi:hypothetical protein [Anabaena sp. UHCC 0253]|uniref:hypothetical protein n=1 Tax=Anabaena sp. UHCC 0253 TaxID=2590019 RepID=UPI0020C33949|nr:hypothetical protein [Anabaena sp. UHCC 0253]
MFRIYTQQPFSVIPFSIIGQIGKKIRIIQSGVWLLLAIPLWLTTEAIAPQVVQAYTARVDLLIDRLPEESYDNVLRRAEAAARATTQRSFDQDILVTEVSVIISAQNQGAIAPILSLEVSRPQWKKRPDPQLWSNYFKTARFLLLFDQEMTTNQPEAATPAPQNPNPEQPPNNPPPADPPEKQ